MIAGRYKSFRGGLVGRISFDLCETIKNKFVNSAISKTH